MTRKFKDACQRDADATDSHVLDRQWFEAHPNENEYTRAATPEEISMNLLAPVHQAAVARVEALGQRGEWVGEVTVRQIAPGIRTRQFQLIHVPRSKYDA